MRAIMLGLAATALATSALAQAGGLTDLKQHVAAAHMAAGKDFAWQADMLCLNATYGGDLIGYFHPRMSDADVDFVPTEIFDGVWYVGMREIGAYAVKTSAGVILIDSLPPDLTDSKLIPHLKAAGIAPEHVKYVVVTHAHADHMGGAKAFQDRFKAKVVLTGPDWDMAEKQPASAPPAPRRDVVVADGDKVTLGDRTLTILFTPGHTPGSLSVLMDVKDHGTPHKALLFGGAGWGLAAMPMPMRPLYAKSLEHLEEAAAANHVDVALEGHPFLSNSLKRIAEVRQRAPGAANALVIGEDGYKRYITVFKECHAASTDRYRMLADKYGADPKAWPTQFPE